MLSLATAGTVTCRGACTRFQSSPSSKTESSAARQPHHAVLDLGPAELALLQSLGDENHARAIPEDQLDPVSRLRVIVHLSCQIPGSLSVLTSCKALKFFGRRAITSRTPICTVSVASAATGTCQGAEGMICWAGSTPWRISR